MDVRRSLPSVVILVVVVLGWAAPAAPQAEDLAGARARFEGTWQLEVTPRQAQQTIEHGIERAIEGLPFYAQPIARDRLRSGTPVIRRIELAFGEDGAVQVSFDGRRYETPIGRTVARTRQGDGERLRVTQRLRPTGELEQVFEGASGTRWYVYTPLGADEVRVDSTTNSERLPQPVHFALEYRRR